MLNETDNIFRNESNFFSEESTVNIERSTWKQDFNHKTTFNNGYLIPFFANSDILPGMTIKNKTTIVVRMTTPKYPTMDTIYCDTYWFKIPWWTIWTGTKQFFGENENGAWAIATELSIPKIKIGSTGVTNHDILNYIGIPYGLTNFKVNALITRAYARVYNYWFRNQNIMAPIKYETGNADVDFDHTRVGQGGMVARVAKFYDYFTAALPEPQKGDAVTLPLGVEAPVTIKGNGGGIKVKASNIGTVGFLNQSSDTGMQTNHSFIWTGTKQEGNVYFSEQPGEAGLVGITDLTQATAATINAIRTAFFAQRILEKDARFGTMYHQIIQGHFGVNSPNASLHIPEYLGGSHFAINIDTVLQNSSSNETSPLGETGAYSVSLDVNDDFVKSFDEHCVLLGVLCCRAKHSYQQGVARQHTRTRRLDLYWPAAAHLGNQPIYNYELRATGNETLDNQVFGFKEAWSEYKYLPDIVSGMFQSAYPQSLDNWHYADYYNNTPTLQPDWINEGTTFVDRTLVTQSDVVDQFIADINVEQTVAAPMPVHCTPGLIDHF